MEKCIHYQGQSVSYRKQDLRQVLGDGQGLREDWRALRRKERTLGKVGGGRKDSQRLCGAVERAGVRWDDGAWKTHGLWNHGKELGSGTQRSHRSPRSAQCSLENTPD